MSRLGIEHKVTQFLRGNSLLEDEDKPDRLASLIQELVPRQGGTTRVVVDHQNIMLYSERTGRFSWVGILPKYQAAWRKAWKERKNGEF